MTAVREASGQAWPAFALVAGLPMIGTVAEADGLFAALGAISTFTGALSAYLWYRATRSAGVRPSLKTSSALGIVPAPIAIAAALIAPQA